MRTAGMEVKTTRTATTLLRVEGERDSVWRSDWVVEG